MIEKINQITDLLIVPSVDENPKLAINQIKILNLLVELRAEAEQCNIDSVSTQRELFYSFLQMLSDDDILTSNNTHDQIVNKFNKTIK